MLFNLKKYIILTSKPSLLVILHELLSHLVPGVSFSWDGLGSESLSRCSSTYSSYITLLHQIGEDTVALIASFCISVLGGREGGNEQESV